MLKPLRPLEHLKPLRPLKPLKLLKTLRPLKTLKPLRHLKALKPRKPLRPLKPLKPLKPLRPLKPSRPLKYLKPLRPLKSLKGNLRLGYKATLNLNMYANMRLWALIDYVKELCLLHYFDEESYKATSKLKKRNLYVCYDCYLYI